MRSIEILSPAGSPECVKPAVRMGANAIYLGLSDFSARGRAKNFTNEELKEAVEYCHATGVKVFIALNTLIKDSEIDKALELAEYARKLCVDAFIVQDMGLFSLLRKLYPTMHLHASTQTSVHTSYGVNFFKNIGFDRVVLPRELNKHEIKKIVDETDIETEVFVHGALCMSFSGQCYMSAMFGTRSANRGNCAGSCRLPFRVKGLKNDHLLSLKDNCIIPKLCELESMGVTSAKIEGRMKRPEYVAVSAKSSSNALNGIKDKNIDDKLQAVFSRDGFTNGYYEGKINNNTMLGTRTRENVISADKKVLSEIRQMYKNEIGKIRVDLSLSIENNTIQLKATDENGNNSESKIKITEESGIAFSDDKINEQLSKMGNTIFYPGSIEIKNDNSSMARLSDINKARREALDKLYAKRAKRKTPLKNENFKPKEIAETNKEKKLKLRAFFEGTKINDCFKNCELVYIPSDSKESEIESLQKRGFRLAVHLPRFINNPEKARESLNKCKKMGINSCWGGTIDAVEIIKSCAMEVHGGFSLNVFNKYALDFYKENGVSSIELSSELTFREIDKIAKSDIDIKKGIVAYGYMPLMLCRCCPVKYSKVGCAKIGKKCENVELRDRMGKKFKIFCKKNFVEILNSVPLNIGQDREKIKNVDFAVLHFSVENSVECFENYRLFNSEKALKSPKTRGLYLRGVE